MKSLAKLERKMSRWISEENDFDELESLGVSFFEYISTSRTDSNGKYRKFIGKSLNIFLTLPVLLEVALEI